MGSFIHLLLQYIVPSIGLLWIHLLKEKKMNEEPEQVKAENKVALEVWNVP